MITAEWLAGFFDGEGCVTIGRARGTHFTPTVVLCNTHLPTLLEIRESFGGTLHSKGPHRSTQSDGYMLIFSGAKSAIAFLQKIRPFVITKRDEVEYFLSNWPSKVTDGREHQRVTPEQVAIRETIKRELSAFKSRTKLLNQTIN